MTGVSLNSLLSTVCYCQVNPMAKKDEEEDEDMDDEEEDEDFDEEEFDDEGDDE